MPPTRQDKSVRGKIVSSQVLSAPNDLYYECGAHTFTPMQRKILDGVRTGQLNKQIAFELGIAETTVKAHMTAIMRKLNVRNRTQVALVAQAMKAGDGAERPGAAAPLAVAGTARWSVRSGPSAACDSSIWK